MFRREIIMLFTAFLIIGTFKTGPSDLQAQEVEDVVHFTRGKLWESFTRANIGQQFDNFRRHDYAMDWPGFEYERVGTEIGGPFTHHAGSGINIGALRADSAESGILGVARFGIRPTNLVGEGDDKYVVTKNTKKYKNGANYWLQTNPNDAEEVVETIWEFNNDYTFEQEGGLRRNFLPIRIHRTGRQWSGSQSDENYIIMDYVIENISQQTMFQDSLVGPDTLFQTYIMFTYSFSINHRSLQILYPQFADAGNRDNMFEYDKQERLFYGWNDDFSEEPGDDTFDYWPDGGPNQRGEWLAPAYVGLKFLYISPNDSGEANYIHDYTWSAQDPTTVANPFINASGLDKGTYSVIKDPSEGANRPGREEDHFGSERMVTCVTLGPFTLVPGDSIHFVTAEAIGGISYKKALDPNTNSYIVKTGEDSLFDTAERAQFNYDHGYNIPDPPAAPHFTMSRHEPELGNIITWSDSVEQFVDNDYQGYEAYDLAGYKIYRSSYLPIGPWDVIAKIPKGDPTYYTASTRTYAFTDTNVTAGEGYYYSLTSYDSGHNSWPPDPSIGSIDPLESSIFANRRQDPFYTGPPSAENLSQVRVVPNPFIIESGFTIPKDSDVIQFVNIPGVCTIRIYSLQGNLVEVIRHTDGTGSAKWDQVTRYGQFAESGVYLYLITDDRTGQKIKGKFAIVK